MPELQRLKKLMEEPYTVTVRLTLMITSEPQIPGKMMHSTITSPKVRLPRKQRSCIKPGRSRCADNAQRCKILWS